eukprot:COSAG02_NODE_16809_length_1054_cov_1.278534_2_plen_44_part_01
MPNGGENEALSTCLLMGAGGVCASVAVFAYARARTRSRRRNDGG